MNPMLLFTDSIDLAKSEIKDLGGRVTQELTNSVFVANLPPDINYDKLIQSATTRPNQLDPVSSIVASAFSMNFPPAGEQASSTETGYAWDSLGSQAPAKIDDFALPDLDLLEGEEELCTGTPTSLAMVGTVSVGVVVVSGEEEELAFTANEREKVLAEVIQGTTFLADEAPRGVGLNFIFDIHFLTVNATRSHSSGRECSDFEECESVWRNPALEQLGFTPSKEEGCREYAESLIEMSGSDWSSIVFFTKYPQRHYAYASKERICIQHPNSTYTLKEGNEGWKPDRIDAVFVHEICHIFGAADEYGRCKSRPTGTYNVPNGNCVKEPQDCIMYNTALQICEWTRAQIGWPGWYLASSDNPEWSDQQGWNKRERYSTIQTVVVGTSMYLLGRNEHGMSTYEFDTVTNVWTQLVVNNPRWSDKRGWDAPALYTTIHAVAVDGDIYCVARGPDGMLTYKFDTEVDTWTPIRQKPPGGSEKEGWEKPDCYATIQAAAVGSDLYYMGRGAEGMWTSKLDTHTNEYTSVRARTPRWCNRMGWDLPDRYTTIQTAVIGTDLYYIGRGVGGMSTYKLDTIANKISVISTSTPNWSNEQGWDKPEYYSTIQTVAVGTDLYYFGRAADGISTYKLDTKTKQFTEVSSGWPMWSDDEGWDEPQYYSTIQTAVVGNEVFCLGRGPSGVQACVLKTQDGTWSYASGARTLRYCSDGKGFDGMEYCSTIRTAVVGDSLYCIARCKDGMHTWNYCKRGLIDLEYKGSSQGEE